jgi:hypothetical protein
MRSSPPPLTPPPLLVIIFTCPSDPFGTPSTSFLAALAEEERSVFEKAHSSGSGLFLFREENTMAHNAREAGDEIGALTRSSDECGDEEETALFL